MGAARLIQAKWRGALGTAVLLTTGASFTVITKRAIRCDSGLNAPSWKARNRYAHSTTNQRHNDSTNAEHPKDELKPFEGASNSQFLEDGQAPEEEVVVEPESAWDKLTRKIGIAKDSLGSTVWSELLKNYSPEWTSLLPGTFQNLQTELSMAPGSLADEVWSEAHDTELNPEITREANVRIGEGLSREEQYFQWRRRQSIVKHLASYLNIKEEDIHPDDVPVIAMCGSGGGLRALVAGAGSYLAAKDAGLWDCVMYTAGVSGSCWLQTIYNTTLGEQDFTKVVDHLKTRIGTHIAFPPDALDLFTTPPTNKYLLRGIVEKLKGDTNADFGIVDVYGLLLAARLLVPEGKSALFDPDLKLSSQRRIVNGGAHPLPIYTAVRHEIPKTSNLDVGGDETSEELKELARQESWFQWFEFSPYELFCEELSAGIPMWALGRHFNDGKNVPSPHGSSLPELRIPGLMGVWGSAFCATLAHYYKEVRPALRGLAGFDSIDSLIEGKNEDLSRVHPIDPATIPNFVLGLKSKLPKSCPESVFEDSHLRLMDAGMSNNLPIYPLLRAGRDVDLVVAFDASADVKEDNWLSVVDGYARQRGIKGWPIGSGWPRPNAKPEETAATLEREEKSSAKEADIKMAAARNTEPAHNGNATYVNKDDPGTKADDLTYCNIWVGTTEERISMTEPPPPTRLFHSPTDTGEDSEFRLMQPDAGIAVAYFPFLPNPGRKTIKQTMDRSSESSPASNNVDKGDNQPSHSDGTQGAYVDPSKDDFMSTWNFVYTPEQIDSVIDLAKTNFAEGEDQLKRVVRGIYERKKKARLEKEYEKDRENACYLS